MELSGSAIVVSGMCHLLWILLITFVHPHFVKHLVHCIIVGLLVLSWEFVCPSVRIIVQCYHSQHRSTTFTTLLKLAIGEWQL